MTGQAAERTCAVVGAGPAGLFAAEILARAGLGVTVFDRMPSPGRKLLMAGRGGLNLTHSEAFETLLQRYGAQAAALAPALRAFDPAALIAWANELGQETFVGSSGRIFPKALKASPLLRAWLARLDQLGVRLAMRHLWTGWAEDGALRLTHQPRAASQAGNVAVAADVVVLALGGATWPRLGSDGGWATILRAEGVPVSELRPANCGVHIPWSNHLIERHAGTPLKRIAVTHEGRTVRGEAVVTRSGLEGGAVYALSASLRAALDRAQSTTILLDLRPDIALDELTRKLSVPRGKQSMASVLRKQAGLWPAASALLREAGKELPREAAPLAALVKALPLTVTGLAGLERAISTAGGIAFSALDADFMLKARPGVFVAGEMLDWEAPTGGYLLQASFATGRAAAQGALKWLATASPWPADAG